MIDLDVSHRTYTEGKAYYEYYMRNGLSLCCHNVCIGIDGDFYKAFFNEQIAFLNYLQTLDTVFIEGSFNCKVVNEKKEVIKYTKFELGVGNS